VPLRQSLWVHLVEDRADLPGGQVKSPDSVDAEEQVYRQSPSDRDAP